MIMQGHFCDVEYIHLDEQSSSQVLDFLLFFLTVSSCLLIQNSHSCKISYCFLKEMVFLSLIHISREVKISEISSKSSGMKSISFFFTYTNTCLLICSQNELSAGKLPEACGVIFLAFYGSQQ